MLCYQCKQNESVRKYKQIKNGIAQEHNYCFDCYQKLLLSLQSENSEENELSACPYCGTTEEEFRKSKLVGCVHCYQTLKSVSSVITRMQGKKAHQGKYPSIETESLETFQESVTFEMATEEQIEKTRLLRQCRELTMIIEKLKSEGEYEKAKGYADKLSLMRSRGGIEADFVWR